MSFSTLSSAAGGALLNLLFPPTCAACGGRDDAPTGLCALCLASIDRVDPFELGAHLAKLPQADASQLSAVHAIWRFDVGGAFQQAHHRLKYGGQPHVGHALGVALGGHVDGLGTWDSVVCVGQSRARYLERGYNQAEPIARGVSQALGVPFLPGLLLKEAGHASQTRLSRSARSANAAHAFEASSPASGARILLVDDVLTTGATLAAGADALVRAGAARVDGAVLAWAR